MQKSDFDAIYDRIVAGAKPAKDWMFDLISITPSSELIGLGGEEKAAKVAEWWKKAFELPYSPKPGTTYCRTHNTYPADGEPCWQCANPFIQRAYEDGLSARSMRPHPGMRVSTESPEKLWMNEFQKRLVNDLTELAAAYIQKVGIDPTECEIVVEQLRDGMSYSMRTTHRKKMRYEQP